MASNKCGNAPLGVWRQLEYRKQRHCQLRSGPHAGGTARSALAVVECCAHQAGNRLEQHGPKERCSRQCEVILHQQLLQGLQVLLSGRRALQFGHIKCSNTQIRARRSIGGGSSGGATAAALGYNGAANTSCDDDYLLAIQLLHVG